MLVCSVSPRGRRIYAAAIIEAANALDAPSLGPLSIVVEAAIAADTFSATVSTPAIIAASVDEVATATDAPDATATGVTTARSGMVGTVMVNSDGTVREANADGIMVNL